MMQTMYAYCKGAEKGKFDFKFQQVTFIGHQLSSEVVKLDPNMIDTIVNNSMVKVFQ